MTLNKYAVALLQLAILMIAAIQAALADGLSVVEVWQLVGLFAFNVGVYLAPVLPSGWAAGTKVIIAVIGAIVTAVIPLLAGEWTAEAFLIVVLAAVSAFAAQFGVDVRVDSVKEALLDPATDDRAVTASDPKAASAARHRLAA